MIFRRRERDDPMPNITPLVDILFLLIIFFTVTTTFATSGGIDISLPEAASQRSLEKVDKLYVVVNRQGQAHIEGERMSDRELSERFRELSDKDADALVVIEADRQTSHGRVVTVMDLAKTAGLKRLAIATEQKQEPLRPPPDDEKE